MCVRAERAWLINFVVQLVDGVRDLCITPPFARFLRQTQILILEILNVFLWLHEVKRKRYIIAFLELEQN